MNSYLLKNGSLINEGRTVPQDIYINNGRIEKIASSITSVASNVIEIDCTNQYIAPGIIDDQVHFRDPGITHKADIQSESKAAVAGGVTSFMEMPNTIPNAISIDRLEEKYSIASKKSWANYSFYMGASNDNIDEILKVDNQNVCGVKIFMGASTGNMLVDNIATLKAIFQKSDSLIATHCEDEATIQQAKQQHFAKYKNLEDVPDSAHPIVRNRDACFRSSSFAVELAKEHQTRLHVLHLTTEDELILFSNQIPIKEKNITCEVCCHHLYFDNSYYDILKSKIKCNPSIKTKKDKQALVQALQKGVIDVVASDHAPHTLAEKNDYYYKTPAGLPLVQHTFYVLMELFQQGFLSLEEIIEKTSHNVADIFCVQERGYIREGYFADIMVFDTERPMRVSKDNIFYKCGWSPFESKTFRGDIIHTFVNGFLAYSNHHFFPHSHSQRLQFNKNRKY